MADHDQVWLDVLLDPHVAGIDPVLDEEQRPVQDPVHTDALVMGGLALAGEHLQVPGKLRHAIGEVADEVHVAHDLIRIAALGENPCAGNEGLDCCERLVDLMGQCGGHASECCELSGLDKRVLRRAQARLRTPALVHLRRQRGVCVPQLPRALVHLLLELYAGVPLGEVGAVTLKHVEKQR